MENKNLKKIKLAIEGMHCASCASNIERSLKSVKGVSNANVSLMLKKANVEVEDSVTDDDLKKAVAKVGYKVVKVE